MNKRLVISMAACLVTGRCKLGNESECGKAGFTLHSRGARNLQFSRSTQAAAARATQPEVTMRVITMSRILVTLSALTLAGACNDDSFSPVPPPPAGGNLAVVPRNSTLKQGQVVALQANLIDEHGDRLIGFATAWRSSDDAVATVANNGEVYARTAGFAVITATAAGKSQIATVRVIPRDSKPGKPNPNMDPARR